MEREKESKVFGQDTSCPRLAVSAALFFFLSSILLAKRLCTISFSSSFFVIPTTAPPLAGYFSFPFLSFFLISSRR
jgi:hypothetical protein